MLYKRLFAVSCLMIGFGDFAAGGCHWLKGLMEARVGIIRIGHLVLGFRRSPTICSFPTNRRLAWQTTQQRGSPSISLLAVSIIPTTAKTTAQPRPWQKNESMLSSARRFDRFQGGNGRKYRPKNHHLAYFTEIRHNSDRGSQSARKRGDATPPAQTPSLSRFVKVVGDSSNG